MRKFFIFIFIFIFLARPFFANAQVPFPEFGGYVLFSTPCTCPPFGLRIQYGLLYPLLYPWVTHALMFSVGSIPYAYQEFLGVPTTWELGDFVPGPTVCMTGLPPDACVPVPADGEIFQVGSSFPGWPPPVY